MPYTGQPSYPNNAPAGAPNGTSYTPYQVSFNPNAPAGGATPAATSNWSSIMQSIANAFGFGSQAPSTSVANMTTPTSAATQPLSYAGTMDKVADSAASTAPKAPTAPTAPGAPSATAPSKPLTSPTETAVTGVLEDRATRSGATGTGADAKPVDYAGTLSDIKAPADITPPTAPYAPTPPEGAGVEAAHAAAVAGEKAVDEINNPTKGPTVAPIKITNLSKTSGLDVIKSTGAPRPTMSGPAAGFVIHHTAGGKTVQDIINTFHATGNSSQFVVDRDGQVYQLTPEANSIAGHIRPSSEWGKPELGLDNTNTIGVEVIANDDADVNPAQIAATEALYAQLAPANNWTTKNVWAHTEVNPGHKNPQEGMTIANAIRGDSRFAGVPVAVDPFANATTYGAGGPATGGNFTRDPAGNPVPPANVGAGTSGATPEMASSVDYLMTAGNLTREQAAGLVGGFAQESYPDLRTGAAGDKGVSHGIGQWNGPRWDAAQAWAAANGRDINDRKTQLDFVLHELSTTEKAAGTRLRAAKTIDEAIAAAAGYERPSGYSLKNPAGADHYANRAAYAKSAFGSGGAAPAAAGAPPGIDYSIPGAGFGQPEAVRGGPAPAAPVLASAPPAATLRIGASGPGVKELQQQLLNAGFNPGPLDGQFGQRTRDALFKFQEAHPGTGTRFGYSDAVAGPKTRAALAAAQPVPTPRPRPSEPPPSGTLFAPPPGQPPPSTGGADVGGGRIGPSYAEGGDVTLKGGGPILPSTGGADFASTLDKIAAAADVPMPRIGPPDDIPVSSARPVAPDLQVSAPPVSPPQPPAPAGVAAVPGAGPRSPLFTTAMDEAKRAAADRITGGGGTDRFAGGPTGVLPPPTLPGATPPVPSGFAPRPAAPYRDPGMEPERLDRLRQEMKPAGAPGPVSSAIFNQPPERIMADMSSMPPEQRVEARGNVVSSVMDAVNAGGAQVVNRIEASPTASRQLAAALGPDKAREFTTMLRVQAGGPELGQRLVAAAPAARVDPRVAANVGRMLASQDPNEFARAVRLVAANQPLSSLLRQVA